MPALFGIHIVYDMNMTNLEHFEMKEIGVNYQKTLNYIKKRLDTSIHDFATRNEIVKEILQSCPYIEHYWEQKNHVYNSDKPLEADSPYGMMVSRLTNYLLMSDESKQMSRQEETTYVFTDEYMKRKINRESITVDEDGEQLNILDSMNLQIVARPKRGGKNVLMPSKVTIDKKKDLYKDTYMSRVLTDYQLMINTCITMHVKATYNRRLLNWQLHTLRDDQKLAKEMLSGYFGKHLQKYPQPQKELNVFDWRDGRTLLKLLQMRGDFYQNYDFWLTCFDLQCLLDKIHLTDDEDMVRKMLYKGFTIKDIEYFSGIKYNQIYYGIIPNIIKKIQQRNIPYDVEVNPSIIDKIEQRDETKLQKKEEKLKNDNKLQQIY